MAHLRFLDSHHHLWDLQGLSHPWLQEAPVQMHFGDYKTIRKDYLPTDFAADTAAFELVASVHIEAGVRSGLQLQESQWITEMHAEHGIPDAAVAKAALDQTGIEAELERQSAMDIVRGVRDMLFPPGRLHAQAKVSDSNLADKNWLHGFSLLSKYGLSFDLQAPPPVMAAVAEMLAEYPDTQVVLTHCGLPLDRSDEGRENWRQGMKALAEQPNLQVKISGLPMTDRHWTEESLRPWVLETIDFFGPARCMFGSNFPVDKLFSDYPTLISAYSRIIGGFSDAEREAMFVTNAAGFYRLDISD